MCHEWTVEGNPYYWAARWVIRKPYSQTQIDTDSLDSLSRACLTARFGVACTAVLASWRKEEGGNTRAGTVVCYSGMVCITYINSKTPA